MSLPRFTNIQACLYRDAITIGFCKHCYSFVYDRITPCEYCGGNDIDFILVYGTKETDKLEKKHLRYKKLERILDV